MGEHECLSRKKGGCRLFLPQNERTLCKTSFTESALEPGQNVIMSKAFCLSSVEVELGRKKYYKNDQIFIGA